MIAAPPPPTPAEIVRERLLSASRRFTDETGAPGTRGAGRLLRPLVAYAGLRADPSTPRRFWDAVLAVQLAHEASLLHDDVIDAAASRRGEPTIVASDGVARALLAGDHLLTAAYRAATRTECLAFVSGFAQAVERTVAGEARQGRVTGRRITIEEYRRIVLGKSGELFGCALSAAAVLSASPAAGETRDLGRRIGLLYQMLDDLLDYAPGADTGKPPLSDYRSGRWTWLLDPASTVEFGWEDDDLLEHLYAAPEGREAMKRALRSFEEEADRLNADLSTLLPDDTIIRRLTEGWVGRAGEAVRRELAKREPVPHRLSPGERGAPARSKMPPAPGSGGDGVPRNRNPLRATTPAPGASPEYSILRTIAPGLADVAGLLSRHSQSFRFATRFFAGPDAHRVVRVYAYCRFTDDIVDRPPLGSSPGQLLDEWLRLSRHAYEGHPTGIPLLDVVMREMAAARVPFEYAAELAEGMRMDLRGERYADLEALHRYTYRVASVVGLWLSRLSGVHDPALLDRAARMGRAMQVTNILRDVGEDLRRDRLYLPASLLDRHSVTEMALRRALEGGPRPAGYPALIEELIADADRDYEAGLEALAGLPDSFARPMTVAAAIYRAIHDEIRHLGYDNIRQRAHTTLPRKCMIAFGALRDLRAARLRSSTESLWPATVGAAPGGR